MILPIALAVLLVLHGILHLAGFAKSFHLAELPSLTQPISRGLGELWLLAGVLMIAAGVLRPFAPRWWWILGAVALVVSQVVVLTSFRDAKFGTLPNVVLFVAVLYGFASRGPLSLRAEFERDLGRVAPARHEVLEENELARLPTPVQRYVRLSGAVGRPRVQDFHATWVGRIRASPDAAWMSFSAEQLNTLDVPRRFFFMDATMKGLPVDVLHSYDERGATMRVRLLSVKTMVDASGPLLTRGETVTIFNDMCLFAPGELVRPSITWEPIDAHSARARYTQGPNTIRATLLFNDEAELIDFVSDDRNPSPDGTSTPTRWTTPVSDYGWIGGARVAHHGETLWHPSSGVWTYGEFTLTSLVYNAGR